MFCPECRGEFREGIDRCTECGVKLVEELIEPEHDGRPLVVVYHSDDPAVLPLARSLLDETDIPYTIRGEETFGLFPSHGLGLAVDPGSEAAEVLVPEERSAEARELLSQLSDEPGEG